MSEKRTFTEEELNVVVRNSENQVVINPEIFAAQVEIGWKKDQLAKHYDMPAAQIAKVLTALGLKIRKFKKPSFVIPGLTAPAENQEVENVNPAEVSTKSEVESSVQTEVPTEVEVSTESEETAEVEETAEETQVQVDDDVVEEQDNNQEESTQETPRATWAN